MITKAFWDALLNVLQQFTSWLTDQADGGAMVVMQQLIGLIRSLGLITHTDLALVNLLSDLLGWNEVRPLVDAVLRCGLVLAGICGAGHYYWGWRPIPDSLQRVGMAALLARISAQMLDWSLQVMDALTGQVASAMPDLPSIASVNPVLLIVLLLVWAWQLFQLALVSAERISWLIILKPLAPLAFVAWVTPQSAWVTVLYVKMWVGWLLGQFFVIMAIAAMVLTISRGGLEGYFLSLGCLIVARKAIVALLPAGGDGFSAGIKLGPIKV